MDTYHVTHPSGSRIPILISVPHCGTGFPDEIKDEYVPELIQAPDDTDWFVDRLYNFAPSMGVTMISAVLSRWVIDLNRHPESKPLYTDGRIITDLCPTTTFLGQPLYRNQRKHVDADEVIRRAKLYFDPYHRRLVELLDDLKNEFGVVLLWDCHSIRQMVPTIQKDNFPDLILGSADGQSANKKLIDVALKSLSEGGYGLSHNHPFKGGYITRNYGRPAEGQHALQLEMTRINYMDDGQTLYDHARAESMSELLYNTFSVLGKTISSLKD